MFAIFASSRDAPLMVLYPNAAPPPSATAVAPAATHVQVRLLSCGGAAGRGIENPPAGRVAAGSGRAGAMAMAGPAGRAVVASRGGGAFSMGFSATATG